MKRANPKLEMSMRVLIHLGLMMVPLIGVTAHGEEYASISCTGTENEYRHASAGCDASRSRDTLSKQTCFLRPHEGGVDTFSAHIPLADGFGADVVLKIGPDGYLQQQTGRVFGERSGAETTGTVRLKRDRVNNTTVEINLEGTYEGWSWCDPSPGHTFTERIRAKCTIVKQAKMNGQWCQPIEAKTAKFTPTAKQDNRFTPSGGAAAQGGATVQCNDTMIAQGRCGFDGKPIVAPTNVVPPAALYRGGAGPINPGAYLGGAAAAPAAAPPYQQPAAGRPMVCGQNGVVCTPSGAVDLRRSGGQR